MKEDLRKRSAENKKELYKTGGGPGAEPKNEKKGDELLLSIINKKPIEGLGSRFDSNNGDLIIGNEIQNAMKNSTTKVDLLEAKYQLKPSEELLSDEKDMTQDLRLQEELAASASCSYGNFDDIEIVYEDSQPSDSLLAPRQLHLWKKGEDLKRPLSSVLKKNVEKLTPVKRKCETPSRRRPNTVVPLTSSRLGEKYELLVDKKLELVECLKKEHQLRMKALQLDILLKKKQLNIVTNKDSNECLLESQVLF